MVHDETVAGVHSLQQELQYQVVLTFLTTGGAKTQT